MTPPARISNPGGATPMGALDPQDFQRSLKLSVLEGGAWACMVGLAETYFLATAVHLGASPLQLGLTVALPLALGGLGPLTALWRLGRGATRRRFTVAGVTAQVITLLTVSALLAVDHMSVPGLIAGICLYQVTGQAAGTAWSSWYGDVVPAGIRGRWFARRNRVVYLCTCAGLASGGAFLHWIEPGGVTGERSRMGFAILFAIATLFRIASAILLSQSPEPEYAGLQRPARATLFLRTERGRMVLRILGLGAAFHFTVYWAAPYFAPFMLTELHFTYLQYMIATTCVIAFKALSSSLWGHLIDHRGARAGFLLAMFCVALLPLPWIWTTGLVGVLFAQFMSGMSWSGYEVSYFTLLLEKSTTQTRPYVFAAQSIANGLLQLGGALLAGYLLVPLVDSYRGLFLMSACARVCVTLTAPIILRGYLEGGRSTWPKVELRLLGLRPHGGFSMRPILSRRSGSRAVPAAEDEQAPPPVQSD